MASRISGAIETTIYLVVVSLGTLLAVLGYLSLESCIWIATSILLSLLFLSWYRFGQGRHPYFIFIGTLLLFQGGRLLAHLLGAMPNPMEIDVGTTMPFRISLESAEETLLILALSAILIYMPCRLNYKPSILREDGGEGWLPALYALILLTFPFALYKNYAYFSYIRAHGGYMAVYLDNAGVLQSAGTAVRAISLVNSTAILVAYVFERRPNRLRRLLFLYFVLSTFDLLIGFRGKFFSQALGLWYIHKLKSGRGFKILPLILIGLTVSALALFAGAFRDEQSVSTLNPMVFVAIQGVSLNVTEAAVAFSHLFSRFGFHYIWYGFIYNVIRPSGDTSHKLWTADLSLFLDRVHAEMGFGTATSYLAELYLFGGLPAVVVGSIMMGYAFSYLHRASVRTWGALAMAFLLPPMIYWPRVELMYPLAIAVKTAAGILPIYFFVLSYRAVQPLLRAACIRRPALTGDAARFPDVR